MAHAAAAKIATSSAAETAGVSTSSSSGPADLPVAPGSSMADAVERRFEVHLQTIQAFLSGARAREDCFLEKRQTPSIA